MSQREARHAGVRAAIERAPKFAFLSWLAWCTPHSTVHPRARERLYNWHLRASVYGCMCGSKHGNTTLGTATPIPDSSVGRTKFDQLAGSQTDLRMQCATEIRRAAKLCARAHIRFTRWLSPAATALLLCMSAQSHASETAISVCPGAAAASRRRHRHHHRQQCQWRTRARAQRD